MSDFSILMTQFMFALIMSAAEQKLEIDNERASVSAVPVITPPSPTPEYTIVIKILFIKDEIISKPKLNYVNKRINDSTIWWFGVLLFLIAFCMWL